MASGHLGLIFLSLYLLEHMQHALDQTDISLLEGSLISDNVETLQYNYTSKTPITMNVIAMPIEVQPFSSTCPETATIKETTI